MKYFKVNVKDDPRQELHDILNLTGAEVSLNKLEKGKSASASGNSNHEEVYGVLAGSGYAILDGDKVDLSAGDWLRVKPEVERQFGAADDEDFSFVCIQVKNGSLAGFSTNDAAVQEK